MALTETVTRILSWLTMLTHIALILFLAGLLLELIFKKKIRVLNNISEIVKKRALILIFIIASTATLGSLFFSEIAGYEPCKLCWFQRIFMYPQALLAGIALWKKDHKIVTYLISISVIGGLVSIYHYSTSTLARMSSQGVCSASGASCFIEYFKDFGYVTLPMMAFTAFLLIVILSFLSKED